jgi:hypothetical protein
VLASRKKKTIFFETPKGEANEDKYFHALNEKTKNTPAWFYGIERGTEIHDVHGVDFIVKIWVKGHPQKPMSVPIQIKSSEVGKHEYERKHKRFMKVGGIVYMIRKGVTHDTIRSENYALLEYLTEGPRDRFRDFFEETMTKRLDEKGVALMRFIRKKLRKKVKDEKRKK